MKKLFILFSVFVASNFMFAQENVVKFQADVANKNGDILFIKENRNIIKEIKSDAYGHFESSFEIKDGMYQLFDGKEYSDLYLKGGYNLRMKVDSQHFDESIQYLGKGAEENNYLAGKIRDEANYNYDDLLSMNDDEFNKNVEIKKQKDIALLDKSKLDANFVAIQKKSMDKEFAEMKMYFKEKQAQSKLNNTAAPSFNYMNYAGGTTKLEDLKGKYVYIDVWATWCGPCRAELPSLKKIEEKYKGKNIQFVSISVDVDKDLEKWKTFVKEKELGGIQLFADKNWLSDFIKSFGINSIPRFILIDPNGKVVNADANRPSNFKLEEQLDALLK